MEESSLSQNRWQEPRSIFACLSALSAILKRRMGSRKASINRVTLTCAKRWRNLHRWAKELSAREAFCGQSSWREGFAGLARPKLHQEPEHRCPGTIYTRGLELRGQEVLLSRIFFTRKKCARGLPARGAFE